MILLRLKLQPHTAELVGQTALLCVQPVQQTGHRLARFFGAVWLIDWLARPPLCERCLMGKDTQSSWLPTSWWGEPTMALSLLLCLIAHGFLPSPRSSSHAVVIVPPYTTQPHFLPLHCITVSFRWMYSHWLQALSYRKLFFDISKFTYCSESLFFFVLRETAT